MTEARTGEEIYKMRLEYLVVPGSKEVIKFKSPQ